MQFNTFADAASAANHATSYIIINNETGAIKENIGQKLQIMNKPLTPLHLLLFAMIIAIIYANTIAELIFNVVTVICATALAAFNPFTK